MKLSSVLDKFPDRTPVWAIGLVTLIISSAVSFAIVYTASKTEIHTYIQGSNKAKEVAIVAENNTLSSILDLVHNNSKQITDLTLSLQTAQTQNYELLKRISEIEKELAKNKASLIACEEKLLKCRR